MKGFLALVRVHLLEFVRDPIYLFMCGILPLIFLFIFGGIYGNNDSISLKVAVFDDAKTDFSEEFLALGRGDEVFEFSEVESREKAEEMLVQGSLEAIIEIEEGFGEAAESGKPNGEIKVIYAAGQEQAGQVISATFAQIFDEIDKGLGREEPYFRVVSEEYGKEGLSSLDYVISGLVAYALMSVGFTTIANKVPSDRGDGIIRRLGMTPIGKAKLLWSYLAAYMILGVISVAIMMAVAVAVFNFQMRGSWLLFGVYALFGLVIMNLLGLFIAGLAKNQNQGAMAGNLIMFPMMFLSGVFFPSFMMPEAMVAVGSVLPLTPIGDGLRLISTENYSLAQLGPQILMLTIYGVVFAVLMIKTFKFNDEK